VLRFVLDFKRHSETLHAFTAEEMTAIIENVSRADTFAWK
jgi:hypothetical protein